MVGQKDPRGRPPKDEYKIIADLKTFYIKEFLPTFKKGHQKQDIQCMSRVRNDIMNISDSFNSDEKYHQFIIGTRRLIYPDNMPIKTKKGEIVTSIHYDITCRPQKYFRAMIYMTKFVEKTYADIYCYENNTNCDGYTNPIRLYNVFPLRTSVIPKYAPTFFQLMCQFRFATLTHLIVKA